MERISHYEIVRRLGQGGMGEVFEALDLDLGRRVALKFVSGERASDPEALRRFEREARVAAALHHPHIATVYAFERGGERAFIVMELLGGRTLRDVIALGPVPVPEALGVARDVAGALAFAHRHDVVHRDIKPENLMFDAEGRIKVTDFGLARPVDASRLTSTGATLGTPSYMAPELLHGVAAGGDAEGAGGSPAADVFALGVSLYEMLAGVPPFRGHNALSTLYAIANAEPAPIRELRPGVPPGVQALLARMLAKDPAARPAASEVAGELAQATGVPASSGWAVGAAREPAAAGGAANSAVTSAVTLAAERVPARDAGAELPVPVRAAPGARLRAFRLLGALAALLALTALAAWGVGAARERATRRAVALNNEGHDSLVAGNATAARERFEAALALAPRYAEARLNLAAALDRAGDANGAAALYGDVIREHPRRPEILAAAHYGLGELDLQARAWPSAIAHLAEAARRDSARAEYPNNLGFALIQAGRTAEALDALRAARARFPAEAALHKNVALAWLAAGALDSALAAADHSVRLRPAYAAAWLVKLRCEAALGDRAAALASLEALRRLAPGDAALAEAATALAEAPAARTPTHR